MSKLEKYSFGIGDRFGREGSAQLRAIQEINRMGTPVVPVWNKSNREHELTGTTQEAVRKEADEAVKTNGWQGSWFVDADHITLANVDRFISPSDFFTIDVAGAIGKEPDPVYRKDFLRRTAAPVIRGFEDQLDKFDIERFASQYLQAIREIIRLHTYIIGTKPDAIIEISMDEVAAAQSPLDLYFILKELKFHGIEPDTLAPKFSGLFPKGVDYEGDIDLFAREFEDDIRILKIIHDQLEFTRNTKLSIHSGSDKFSIYPVIRELVRKHDCGIHVKTAGTTWLEEVIGLARGGGDGLRIAKEIYVQGIKRFAELSAPYQTVLHIDIKQLPPPAQVMTWHSARFAKTLIHDQLCRDYNPHLRQLVHIAYKVAAEMGGEFRDALEYYRTPVEEQVYINLTERHLKRLF